MIDKIQEPFYKQLYHKLIEFRKEIQKTQSVNPIESQREIFRINEMLVMINNYEKKVQKELHELIKDG